MKTWLAKFRISSALDDDSSVRKQLHPRDGESEAVRRFAESARWLDRRLKADHPVQPVPPGLHSSVMHAVRGASRAQKRQFARTMVRWLPAPALALLVVGGLWWVFNRPENEPQSLATAGVALERSQALTQQAPAAVLAPLSKEMEFLNRDFRNAVEFLVASVP